MDEEEPVPMSLTRELESIKPCVASHAACLVETEGKSRAAVAVILTQGKNEIRLLFIERTLFPHSSIRKALSVSGLNNKALLCDLFCSNEDCFFVFSKCIRPHSVIYLYFQYITFAINI